MCGILALLGCSDDSQAKRFRVLELSRRLKHRGPDWSGLYQHGDNYLSHQRLAVIDPASGDQPLYNEDETVVVTVNGEIYNHMELREKLMGHKFKTGSDCDVIAHLYEEHGENFVDMLDGMFSFVLLDTRDNSYLVARDAIGITSLYIGWGLDGSVWISSELKGLNDDCEHFEVFPPGHLYSSKSGGFRRWYNPPWFSESIPSTPYDPLVLRRAFENAVIKRLMTDVPFGVLLSGGLDSSLVASVTARHLAGSKAAKQWGAQLHSFCVGLEGSPDLKAAREVADYLGTLHHEFHFTVQDGIDAIEDVIYHIETYDVTTIRASTPMFLMSRKIKSLGVKMVISGEGSDEIFGGYLYFHKAPNKEEFHQETCRKIKALHQYDCLRANKSTSAWGLEARVPFLDKEFINVAMSIDPEAKMINMDQKRIEKWILRRAFDDEEKPYLPKHILYRQKEQFSDGVGYSWIDGLKSHAEQHVTNKMMLNAERIFPHNTPVTKEAYYYRMIFERFFPQNSAKLTVPGGASVACSTAKAIEWDASWSNNLDPSGRAALGVHNAAYKKNSGSISSANLAPSIADNVPRMMDITGPELVIRS
ncbi:Asparagine synthetase [glutamine-hydrolyzing] [Helianthus annuus]|uniref:Asparagine synthetase [glutamine-hydrolyzing] n=1 Tax=Helianthus annuus TaxID=4232 RepID=A0A251U7K1_HELAN|nr:asparagine synthetase [glutamine-hydrolyzing] 1 [Helianthus annuus]KAF5795932.1 putative asparagine synthase, glutamine-hydrolyzing, rossmann-like alpha/beta/alpha sandwich [Helianthus annuus]KAJ0554036.1 Asparagine synthetase [glutamine-hydrolyzing] [Helianthus annuus]KAJ0898456.1 Asparagine synthetase [glutamine-hydrolyzing] [Helianthus annuus]KAJ0902171.1 Asparagine synthetase [glutamine-hydrolyzing] [Helianthus annuus]